MTVNFYEWADDGRLSIFDRAHSSQARVLKIKLRREASAVAIILGVGVVGPLVGYDILYNLGCHGLRVCVAG